MRRTGCSSWPSPVEAHTQGASKIEKNIRCLEQLVFDGDANRFNAQFYDVFWRCQLLIILVTVAISGQDLTDKTATACHRSSEDFHQDATRALCEGESGATA